MGPKRKSQTSFKHESDKKVHVEINENSGIKCKGALKDDFITGKDYNLLLESKNKYAIPKKKNTQQEASTEVQDSDQDEFSSSALNQLLQEKSKLSFQASVSWKIFEFSKFPNSGSDSKNLQSYFGLDLVEEGTERTVWTHKASVWKDIVQSIFELAESGENQQSINRIFHGLLACPVRAVPNGPNEPETFKSAKGQRIQHWIMLVPMPADIDTSEYIPLFISEFTSLSKKAFIRSAYHYQVSQITKHSGLLNQISSSGIYWNIIDKASQNDVITQHNNCLSEVLLDFTIREVVSVGLGVSKNTNTWSESIQHYAFGN